MKKVLLLAVLALGLYSCKKNDAITTDITPKTWISGYWTCTNSADTLYNGKTVKSIDYSISNPGLNFTSETTGTAVNNTAFTYSLSTLKMSLFGQTWDIIKKSDTEFDITAHDNVAQIGFRQTFKKQ